MIAWIDTDMGGNRTKFAYGGINDIAIIDDIGIIIHRCFGDFGAGANLGIVT